MRRARQMSGTQSHDRRVQFLAGVEVREVRMDDWVKANEAFRPVWRG
ncbi:MAG TPA: hypothetical protein VIN03_13890 [Roseateles sp.]